jgi:hypothetical protein
VTFWDKLSLRNPIAREKLLGIFRERMGMLFYSCP